MSCLSFPLHVKCEAFFILHMRRVICPLRAVLNKWSISTFPISLFLSHLFSGQTQVYKMQNLPVTGHTLHEDRNKELHVSTRLMFWVY